MKKIILWIVGGILLTTGAFFIPEQSGDMWPSVLASGAVALLYLVLFSLVWLKKIKSTIKRRAISITLSVLILFSIASAAISYEGSVRQAELLPVIRTTIETGIAEAHIKDPLLETFRMYHTSEKGNQNIGALFTSKYDSLITEDKRFTYGSRNDEQTLYLFVAKVASDSVVLIGESSYIDGKDPNFTNFSGEKGRFQVEGILTSKGVDYERRN